MKSTKAAKPLTDAIERVAERNRGVNRSVVGFSATRMSEVHIADMSKLPHDNNPETQNISTKNDAGQNLFLLGYSVLGGPDVMG